MVTQPTHPHTFYKKIQSHLKLKLAQNKIFNKLIKMNFKNLQAVIYLYKNICFIIFFL